MAVLVVMTVVILLVVVTVVVVLVVVTVAVAIPLVVVIVVMLMAVCVLVVTNGGLCGSGVREAAACAAPGFLGWRRLCGASTPVAVKIRRYFLQC